jgi:hypothetical protein
MIWAHDDLDSLKLPERDEKLLAEGLTEPGCGSMQTLFQCQDLPSLRWAQFHGGAISSSSERG